MEVKLQIPECSSISCTERCAAGSECDLAIGQTKIGSSSCTGSEFGSECSYQCEDGFNLMGPPVATCVTTGWNSTVPQCVRAACPERATPRYGSLKCSVKGALKCTYKCEDGYTLFPPDYSPNPIRCTSRGKWTNDAAPLCQPISCPALPDEQNGVFACSKNYEFSSICSLICGSGHRVSGTNERLFYQSCGVNEALEPAWKVICRFCRKVRQPVIIRVARQVLSLGEH